MNIKKLFIPLFVSLVTGCYHNPFLADTYNPIPPNPNIPDDSIPDIKEEALYNTSYFLQSKDLKSYELKDEIPGKNIVGTEVTADIKTYTGFTFDDTHKGNITNGIVAEDGSLKLKLHYNRNKYTVTFDKNNESATGEMEPQTFYYDVSASLPANSFAYIGHVFTGWAKTADATEVDFTDSNSVSNLVTENNGNITLYAVWVEGEPVDYTVEYYLQTADLSGYEKSENSKILQHIAGKEVKATTEKIDGFTFYEEHPENITSGTITKGKNLILKLYYNRNNYTVTFDKNCKTAVGEMEPQFFYYEVDETQKLNKNQFTDEYHEFLGWAETSDATDKKYKDEEILDFDLATGSGTLNLYAVWSTAEPASIDELTVKIADTDDSLEDKSTISTSRNFTASFKSTNAAKTYYSLGEKSEETKSKTLDFTNLTDGGYTLKVWAENIDGVKSEEKEFSWTIACLPKLRIKGTPAPIIEIDTQVNINVSGDNLESCFYSLDGGDSTTDIPLKNDGIGSFNIDCYTTGDFTLTVTGKNILNETTDKTFNWKVVKAPKAVLSEIPQSLNSDTTFDITVSGCDYYMYKIEDGDWSEVFQVSQPISIKNTANNTNSYNIYVIGGHTQTYSNENFIWQSKETPTTVTWQLPSISLSDVLHPDYMVAENIDGKNLFATYDDNFVYFGYYDKENKQQFCYDGTEITALCVGIYSDTAESESFQLDGIDQAGNENQPTLTINRPALTHFVRIVFDSETSGIPAFYKINNNNKWIETDSSYINFKVMEGGQCAIAIPRSALNNPKSKVKYVIYMRDYKSGKIYAAYPTVSNSDNNYFINDATTLIIK